MEEWLIVDGYNVIGAHPGWSTLSLEEARYHLATLLSEYQAVSGRRVVLVFDAHRSPGGESKLNEQQVTIYFTREHETADQLIERLVSRLKGTDDRIYVVTSDYLEQRIIFGQGAYRISSRELLEEFKRMKGKLAQQMDRDSLGGRYVLGQDLGEEVLETLEKWRRKK